jgi:very-short-patch-repair endonuclease
MGALIDGKKGLSRKDGTAVRNRFDRKRIDFVLEERSTGDVLALVELDDRTHSQAKDRSRDEITAAAGFLTVRLRAGGRLDQASVQDAITAALAQAKSDEDVGSASGGRRKVARP